MHLRPSANLATTDTSIEAPAKLNRSAHARIDDIATEPLATPRSSRRISSPRYWALAAVLLVAGGLVLGYQLDKPDGNEIPRGVSLNGESIGGSGPVDVTVRLDDLSDKVTQIGIQLGNESVSPMTAGQLGISLDSNATLASLFQTGRGQGTVGRFRSWLAGFVFTRDADIHLVIPHESRLSAGFDAALGLVVEPVEPSMAMSQGELVVVPGEPGQGFDGAGVAASLPRTLQRLETIALGEIETRDVAPSVGDDRASVLVAQFNRVSGEGFDATFGGRTVNIPTVRLRQWLGAEASDEELALTFDDDAALTHLRSVFAGDGRVGKDATIEIVDGEPVIIAPTDHGSRCCAAATADRISHALESGLSSAYLIGMDAPSEKDEVWAAGLGIGELVGTFTTKHAPGQTRVKNIHRISDLTQGVIIEPGGTFSVNDFIGRRTKDNGFFSAGVIYEGKFTEDYGGGISQYATTLFNAAFFGGYDFGEYQSHSIYISRYPYGREATLSFPNPDLQIINNSPHGVLVWPNYTESTITVDLYSTQWAVGDETGQSTGRYGPGCKHVTTERTRTFVEDGRTEIDTVEANYRPAEGVRC